jgi:hypothetical protein
VLGVWEGCGEEDLNVGGADANDVVGDDRGVVRGKAVIEGLGPGEVGREPAGLRLAEKFYMRECLGILTEDVWLDRSWRQT